MYNEKSKSVKDRIVSINQPHVRPIVRGKAGSQVEFGAKVSASVIDGYVFVDRISWDNYNESIDLIPVVESYKKRTGYYPEAVLADKIYRNRKNLKFCKDKGIRLSGPPLGRPRKSKEKRKEQRDQEYQDMCQRNEVEGKFGQAKRAYGLSRIMAHLKQTSESVIMLNFMVLNLNKRLKNLLYLFFKRLFFCDFTNILDEFLLLEIS